MKQEERQILITEKVNGGEEIGNAYKELRELEKSQIVFKKLNSKLKSLENENMKLKEKVKKLNQTNFKNKLNNLRTDLDVSRKSNSEILRIIHHIKKGEWYNKTNLSRELGIRPIEIESCFKILQLLEKAEVKCDRGTNLYKLN